MPVVLGISLPHLATGISSLLYLWLLAPIQQPNCSSHNRYAGCKCHVQGCDGHSWHMLGTWLPCDGYMIAVWWACEGYLFIAQWAPDECMTVTLLPCKELKSSCSLAAPSFCSAAAWDDLADFLTVLCYSSFYLDVLQFCKKEMLEYVLFCL